MSAENLSKEQSPPKRRTLFSFRGFGKQRRTVVTLLGGWPRVIRLLVMMFVLSICYDLGAFSESTWTDTALASGGDSEDHSGGHANPVTPILLAIVMILFLAKIGGDLFERIGMPAVLGELFVGIILGNFAFLTGFAGLDHYFAEPTLPEHISDKELKDTTAEEFFYQPGAMIKILAEIGVVLLLFEVGLESTVRDMLSVGTSSLLVALLGVVVPMALGWFVGWWLIRDMGWQVHSFLGATLCATSVGITARVLKDLGRSKQRESQIILGAAVIDDVLGLVILAVVTGVISSGAFHIMTVGSVVFKATAFLVGSVVLGTVLFAKPLFRGATYLRGHGLLVSVALVICFGFSYLSALVGLAPIVGAFAAGLILERTHYRELSDKENHHDLEEALAPISALLVPIFFVQMGTQVNLESFQDSSVWGLAAALTVVAIIGKQVCALGVLEKGRNRLAVGLGMIPRGEVGLIFAGVGKGTTYDVVNAAGEVVKTPVIDDNTFSAIIVMVMFTTMVTPPLLKWSLTRGEANPPSEEAKPPMTTDH